MIDLTKLKTAEQKAAEAKRQARQVRISELQLLLSSTDHKVATDYDKPNDDIKIQRQAWRDEIRALKAAA